MRLNKFVTAALMVSLALVIELKFFEPAGLPLQIPLAAIFGLTLVMDVGSIALLSLFSFFILNWRPGFTPEFAAFLVIPILFSVVQSFFPLRSTLNAAASGAVGVALWYLAVNPSGALALPSIVALEIVASGFTAAAVFSFFRWAVHRR